MKQYVIFLVCISHVITAMEMPTKPTCVLIQPDSTTETLSKSSTDKILKGSLKSGPRVDYLRLTPKEQKALAATLQPTDIFLIVSQDAGDGQSEIEHTRTAPLTLTISAKTTLFMRKKSATKNDAHAPENSKAALGAVVGKRRMQHITSGKREFWFVDNLKRTEIDAIHAVLVGKKST